MIRGLRRLVLFSRQQQQQSKKRSIIRLFSTSSSSDSVTNRIVTAREGIKFHVTIRNPNAPHAILCMPGALGTATSDFSALLEQGLGDDDDNYFGIFALDPRGLGGSLLTSSSTVIDRDYPLDFYLRDALDAASVMSELGHEKYSIMGWSDGANSAIHLAAHPNTKQAIQSLVCWGGNAYCEQDDVDGWKSVEDIANWSERFRESKAQIHGGLERLQQLNTAATKGWIDIYEKAAGDICLHQLHQVTCPTLVLHGLKDPICHTKHAQYIARQISNSTLVMFPDGKHNLHQRYADAFHQVVREFLLDSEKETTTTSTTTGDVYELADDNKKNQEQEPAIDEIAYAFMGSKALFVALEVGIFDAIDTACKNNKDAGVASLTDIEELCCDKIRGERLQTLLSACVSLNLIHRRVQNGEDYFQLPKASANELVRSSKRYWGDYIVGQINAQFYTRMQHLGDTIQTGNEHSDGYEAWFESDPEAAKRYTQAQHNGSLATAYGLHKRLPELSDKYPNLHMLDVGGGSGAFSIATCKKLPNATCVVLDLPNVITTTKTFIQESSLEDRISTLALSAASSSDDDDADDWKGLIEDDAFDVVLMSYVSGSIPAEALPGLYKNAYRVLKPGGVAIIHDFFVDNDGLGPKSAALWALAHVSVNPEGMGLRPNRIVNMLCDQGFTAPKVDDLIPGATQLIVATKPISSPSS